MLTSLANVRPSERQTAGLAFGTLFCVMAAHACLETARDALFLATLPASRLPWMYLLMASIAVITMRMRTDGESSHGRLCAALYVAGLMALVFWLVLGHTGAWGLGLLYIWTGITIGQIVIRFWLVLGRIFDLQQAKRLYGIIGIGAVSGAILGFALAGVAASTMGAHALLALSAVPFFVAGGLARRLGRHAVRAPRPSGRHSLRSTSELFRQPYVARLAALLLIASATTSMADWLFKACVAGAVAPDQPDQLAIWFATVSLVLNGVSFAIQIFAVAPLVAAAGVTGVLLVFPVLLSGGAAAFLVGFGLPAAVALKGIDGSLRHTLHRTSSELLFLPLAERTRLLVKPAIDIFSQRGGQAVGSITVLAILGWTDDHRAIAAVILLLVVAWVAVAWSVRGPYIDVFRTTLREAILQSEHRFPNLDLASLEALLAALNSTNDNEVLAAMNILEREGKQHLLPALLLYHPSEAVVLRSIALLGGANRADVVPIIDRVQGQSTPTVHAALLRARARLSPDTPDHLSSLLDSPCPATRATAIMLHFRHGGFSAAQTRQHLNTLLASPGKSEAERAIADVAAMVPSDLAVEFLLGLLDRSEPGLRGAVFEAMAECRDERFIDPLCRRLHSRDDRDAIAKVLATIGPAALEALDRSLADEQLSDHVHWEIPTTMLAFPHRDAAQVLLRHLKDTRGITKYRIIRALDHIQARSPKMATSSDGWGRGTTGRQAIDSAIERTMGELERLRQQHAGLTAGASDDAALQTQEHRLLTRLIHDKQTHALERLLRLVGLTYPREAFGEIWHGLSSESPALKASSIELLELVLKPPLRRRILDLVDRRSAHADGASSYEAIIASLLDSKSGALRVLAASQVAAMGWTGFRSKIAGLPHEEDPLFASTLDVALGELASVSAP